MQRSSKDISRRHWVILFATSGVLVAFAPGLAKDTVPAVGSRLPSISLLEQLDGQKAVLPQGLVLRPVNKQGLALLEGAEGFVGHLYNDAAHYCTIGYGHLIKKAPCDGSEPMEFKGPMTKARAEKLLVTDMAQAQITVMTSVTADLSDNQYAALCDLVFNIGSANFQKSALLRVINAKQFDQVPSQFRRWVRAGGKTFPGLVKRRNSEVALFFKGSPIPKAVPIPGEDLSPLDVWAGTPLVGR